MTPRKCNKKFVIIKFSLRFRLMEVQSKWMESLKLKNMSNLIASPEKCDFHAV